MDVQEAQESQQKVMEAIGQNCEVHQRVKRLGDVHAEGRQAETIEAFLDGDWVCDDLDKKSASGGYLVVADCTATAGRLDNTRSTMLRGKS